MQAAQMFAEGRTRAQVAADLGVSWRSVHNWFLAWSKEGEKALEAQGKPGPAPKFSDAEVDALELELRRGALAHGYANEIWTLPRICRLVKERYERKISPSEAWRLLRRMGWSPQKPRRLARERDEDKIRLWKEQQWPQIQQKAAEEGRTIIFVDESGLTQKPAAKRTWAPRAETPVLEMNFNWDTLSVIGGISLKSIYFQIHEESVKADQVIEFLEHLQRHVRGKILVIWDGLPAHRSKKVAEYLGTTEGRVWVERLPAYAPELNPIEYLWGHIKNTDLANFTPKELWELSAAARKALVRTRKSPRYIQAFWIQTELKLI